MRGVDKMMNELRGMGATRSGSKPHDSDGYKQHHAIGGSIRGPMRDMRPARMEHRESRHEEMEEHRPMRRYATGGNVKAVEMKSTGGGMPSTSLAIKSKKLNAVGPKSTWDNSSEKKYKTGGKVCKNRGGEMLGGSAMNRQGPGFSKGGDAKDSNGREHHWMGTALGMALPLIAKFSWWCAWGILFQ